MCLNGFDGKRDNKILFGSVKYRYFHSHVLVDINKANRLTSTHTQVAKEYAGFAMQQPMPMTASRLGHPTRKIRKEQAG